MKKNILLLSFSLVTVVILGSVVSVSGQQRLHRRRTTTTTIPPPTLSERETNLIVREENLNAREQNFREREANLTLREDSIRLREDKISVREAKLKVREKAGEGSPVTTPAPDLSLVRFDKATNKYQEIGSTLACPENMRFLAIPGNPTDGTCDCDIEIQCSRPLMYSPKYNQCFWAWSQGPCESGEWFTYNDTLHPVCVKNECPSSLALRTAKYYFQDPDDGQCYETTSKGYCTDLGEILLPTADDPFPKCRSHSLCQPRSIPAHQLCIAGSKMHLEGLCDRTE